MEELKKLLGKRFGDWYIINSDETGSINYETQAFKTKPGNKCEECEAKAYRQDLPFWLGNIQKKYMVIAQDAGKGMEPEDGAEDFNAVFSLQSVLPFDGTETGLGAYIYNYQKNRPIKKNIKYLRYFTALILGKDAVVDEKVSKLNVQHAMESCYFTYVVKCAFSTLNNLDLKKCKCEQDFIEEIKMVSPKVVFLFGKKPFNALQNAGFDLREQESIEIKINKTQVRYIKTYKKTGDEKTYVMVPQLGNNRFSDEGFNEMINTVIQLWKSVNGETNKAL